MPRSRTPDEVRAAEVGARIARTRRERGMTQTELAYCVGTSSKTISSLERGMYISYDLLPHIAACLQEQGDFLLYGDREDELEAKVNALYREMGLVYLGEGKVRKARKS